MKGNYVKMCIRKQESLKVTLKNSYHSYYSQITTLTYYVGVLGVTTYFCSYLSFLLAGLWIKVLKLCTVSHTSYFGISGGPPFLLILHMTFWIRYFSSSMFL